MAAPRNAVPAAVRRLEYRPPAFVVDAVDLFFDLDPERDPRHRDVRLPSQRRAGVPSAAAPLVLDGEQQQTWPSRSTASRCTPIATG